MPKKGSEVVLILEKNRYVQRMFCLFCNDQRIKTRIVSTIEEGDKAFEDYVVRAVAIDGCLLGEKEKDNTRKNLGWINSIRKNFNGPIIVMLCINNCNCRQKLLDMTANDGFIVCEKENLDKVLDKSLKEKMLGIHEPQKTHH